MTTQPIILDAAAIAALLPRIEVVETLRGLFGELAAGRAVQPAQSLALFPDDKGDFISYLGIIARRGVFGAKLSPYIVTDARPVVTAWTMLMSMETGAPLLLCDAAALTIERTGGTTALAVDHLARRGVSRLAIIGTGPVAAAHWAHVRGLRNWSEVRLWSPSRRHLPDWAAGEARVSLAASAASSCLDADVVLCCTSSGTPVIDPAWLAPGALVTSISTNVAMAHEVPPGFLNDAQVYCDDRETTPATAGEMVLAARDHGWRPASIRGDLAELVAGSCALPGVEAPTFFRSIGLGLEDIAMAEAILRVARPL